LDYTEIKNLATPGKPHSFKIGEERYDCAHKLPAGVVRDLNRMRRLDPESEEQTEMFFSLLDMILLPESAERFAARMRDPVNPIDMEDVSNTMIWIVEEYGDRPTTPPNGSSPSETPSVTTSTESSPPTAVAI
jgi:hypothetical protein